MVPHELHYQCKYILCFPAIKVISKQKTSYIDTVDFETNIGTQKSKIAVKALPFHVCNELESDNFLHLQATGKSKLDE